MVYINCQFFQFCSHCADGRCVPWWNHCTLRRHCYYRRSSKHQTSTILASRPQIWFKLHKWRYNSLLDALPRTGQSTTMWLPCCHLRLPLRYATSTSGEPQPSKSSWSNVQQPQSSADYITCRRSLGTNEAMIALSALIVHSLRNSHTCAGNHHNFTSTKQLPRSALPHAPRWKTTQPGINGNRCLWPISQHGSFMQVLRKRSMLTVASLGWAWVSAIC